MANVRDLQLPKFIAVTGQAGAGKDTYGAHLAELGYLHVSAGDVVRERARAAGHKDPLSREILQAVGDAFKQEYGPSAITESSIKRYQNEIDAYPTGLAISGLRRAGELRAFKAHGAKALWIEADETRRFELQRGRNRDGDYQDVALFRSETETERVNSGAGDLSIDMVAIESLADCRVTNDGTIDELCARGDAALKC